MLDEFIAKYAGQTKGYPTDNDYRGECLSIVKIYIQEVFGINPPVSGNNAAYGYWTLFPEPLPQVFEKVSTPTRGDIVVWSPNLAGSDGYGHIAIYLYGNGNTFYSFDQNWGGKEAHIQEHNYNNILGYLHPKGINMSWYSIKGTVFHDDVYVGDPEQVDWDAVKKATLNPQGYQIIDDDELRALQNKPPIEVIVEKPVPDATVVTALNKCNTDFKEYKKTHPDIQPDPADIPPEPEKPVEPIVKPSSPSLWEVIKKWWTKIW